MRTTMTSLLLAAGLLSASVALAADERNITVYNATGYGIKFIGVNPPGDEEYTDNEISNVLADGENVYIKFNQSDKGCKWNIKIDWAMEGYPSPLLRDVDLCTIDDIKLTYDKATGTTNYQTR